MADQHRFQAELEAARAGGHLVLIPDEIAKALGGNRQMRVVGTVNGVTYKSSTMPYGGRGLFMGVHKATCAAAGIDLGDLLDVVVARDNRPRVLDIPSELEAAFRTEPELRGRFDRLSFTRRKEMALPISEAKRLETRAARLEKALAELRARP